MMIVSSLQLVFFLFLVNYLEHACCFSTLLIQISINCLMTSCLTYTKMNCRFRTPDSTCFCNSKSQGIISGLWFTWFWFCNSGCKVEAGAGRYFVKLRSVSSLHWMPFPVLIWWLLELVMLARPQNCPLGSFNLGNKTSYCKFVISFLYIDPQYMYILLIPDAVNALKALKDVWDNVPPTWVGADPCGSRWDGIVCTNSRVTSM